MENSRAQEESYTGLEKIRRRISVSVARPVVRLIAQSGITPNMLTWFGFLLAVTAAGLVAADLWLAGGIMVLVAGGFDMFDGALARHTGRVSRFGAVLDSTLDRASEGVLLVALAYAMAVRGSAVGVALAGAVMLFSFLVSYIRSKAETIQLECRDGFFTRSERVIVIALGLIFNQVIITLAIVAFFSIITTLQRLLLVWRKTRAE